ncbi:MAG: hypothetical protein ABSF22_00145 [Bryobacteraceae bacterium]
MLELVFAYSAAAALIAGMLLLALRNQKQGWRRHRGAWFEARETVAVAAFEAKPQPPLQHLGDLVRLQQSLAHPGQTAPVEVPLEVPVKANLLP